MKIHCDIIRDLIPSYVDDICSKRTRILVEEHLMECESCKQMADDLKKEEIKEIDVDEVKDPWLKVRRESRIKNLIVFMIAPLLCLSLFVGWCTLSGEGLTVDALIYRKDANDLLHCLALSDYECASEYLSFYDSDDLNEAKDKWIKNMQLLDADFKNMKWNQLSADDGLVYNYVTATLDSGENVEFRVIVQGKGLALTNIYVYANDELTEKLQEVMTTYYPG